MAGTALKHGVGQARGKGNGSLVFKQQKPIAEELCLLSKGGGPRFPLSSSSEGLRVLQAGLLPLLRGPHTKACSLQARATGAAKSRL